MNFSEQLNYYIKQINCSSKKLADLSGISTATISRYLKGERIPSLRNSQLTNLANALSQLAIEEELKDLTPEKILNNLENSLDPNSIDFEEFRKKLNELISTFSLNISELARVLSFDASYISRIRTGKRTPSNIKDFIDSICNFIATKYFSPEEKKAIALLIGCSTKDISTSSTCLAKLRQWFDSSNIKSEHNVSNFLKKLDEFNLNEYIKIIHFDEMKIPSIPFYKHNCKNYYGLEAMKQGELSFFKSTVLSKSADPIFMCNDMPMEDMANDIDFGKKWMFAIAMTLKKGLHLDIIHNIDRPFNEMMLGLESWIPIYMTGQVSPYYLKRFQDPVYCHFNYVSGKVALTGECIKGFHSDGKYYLTTNSEEVLYYKTKAKNLLSKATPLMEIYRSEHTNLFNSFITSDSNIVGTRRRILSALPIHTISQELLLKILKRNKIAKEDISKILNFVNQQKNMINTILKSSTIIDEIPKISKKSFDEESPFLLLSESFYERKISYTYEEYLEHLKLTTNYKKSNSNYTLKANSQNAFKNIQISIHEGKWVMISKNTNPAIHFVIRHPKLRDAIENFIDNEDKWLINEFRNIDKNLVNKKKET